MVVENRDSVLRCEASNMPSPQADLGACERGAIEALGKLRRVIRRRARRQALVHKARGGELVDSRIEGK